MARDYTKYTVEGLGENLNKRQLVFTVVKDYVEKNNPSFEDLQKAFPDEVHGGNPDKFGLIRKEAEVKNHRYFNMREPLKIKQGVHVVVMNQWGENINDFIAVSEKLGYQINTNNQDSTPEKQKNINIKEEYLNYFQNQTFADVHDFIEHTNQLFENFSWESESDCEEIADLYSNLNEITLKDCPRYGGYLYLFTQISEKMGELEYDTYFDWDIALEHGYDWGELTSKGDTVVKLIGKEYPKNEFKIYFSSLFILTLLRSVDHATGEDIAEFIVSNDIHEYGDVFEIDVSGEEDFVGDSVILILKTMGYDLDDYEGECSINGKYFKRGFDLGYDYVNLATDFRDSNI